MTARAAIAALALAVAGCEAPVDDLDDGLIVLPPVLHEISGLVAISEHVLACVQDEVGAIFLLDVQGGAELRVVAFGPPGDYEGVAFTGSEYWVLRSDGVLLRLAAHGEGLRIAATHRLPKDCEYEGLCFDPARHRLLALPKGAVSGSKREKARRRVFAFDLATMQPLSKPVLTLRLDRLLEAAEQRGIDVPTRTTSKGNERLDLRLRGSELAVVPGTNELLLLSAADHLLLRVDLEGQLLGTHPLDRTLLPQPEAMAFLPDGRLVVASEGVRGPAVISVVEIN